MTARFQEATGGTDFRPRYPAFPGQRLGRDGRPEAEAESGMSLSEVYAGRAMQMLISCLQMPMSPEQHYEAEDTAALARWAFQIGDAMEAEAIRRRGGK